MVPQGHLAGGPRPEGPSQIKAEPTDLKDSVNLGKLRRVEKFPDIDDLVGMIGGPPKLGGPQIFCDQECVAVPTPVS